MYVKFESEHMSVMPGNIYTWERDKVPALPCDWFSLEEASQILKSLSSLQIFLFPNQE